MVRVTSKASTSHALGQSAFCAVAAVAVGFFVEDKTPYNNNVPTPKENPFKSALTVMKLPPCG